MHLTINTQLEHWREDPTVQTAIDEVEAEVGYRASGYEEYDCFIQDLIFNVVQRLREDDHIVKYTRTQSRGLGKILQSTDGDFSIASDLLVDKLDESIAAFKVECAEFAKVEHQEKNEATRLVNYAVNDYTTVTDSETTQARFAPIPSTGLLCGWAEDRMCLVKEGSLVGYRMSHDSLTGVLETGSMQLARILSLVVQDGVGRPLRPYNLFAMVWLPESNRVLKQFIRPDWVYWSFDPADGNNLFNWFAHSSNFKFGNLLQLDYLGYRSLLQGSRFDSLIANTAKTSVTVPSALPKNGE